MPDGFFAGFGGIGLTAAAALAIAAVLRGRIGWGINTYMTAAMSSGLCWPTDGSRLLSGDRTNSSGIRKSRAG